MYSVCSLFSNMQYEILRIPEYYGSNSELFSLNSVIGIAIDASVLGTILRSPEIPDFMTADESGQNYSIKTYI